MEKHSALREATKRVCADRDADFVANQIRHEIVALRNTYDGSIGEACHRWLYNQSKSQSKQKPPIEYDTIGYHLNPTTACFQGHPHERQASLDAFNSLTANEQTLIRLRCENGLSMPEIALRTHQTVEQATGAVLKARDKFWKAFDRLFWTAYFVANLGEKSPHLGEAYLHFSQRLHLLMPIHLTKYLENAINQKRADSIKVKHQESKKLQEYVQSGAPPAVLDAETNQEICTGRTASPSNAPYDDVASREQQDIIFEAGVQLIKEWNRKKKKYLKIEVLLFLFRIANIVPEWDKVIITDPDLIAIIEHWAEEAPLSKTDIADRYGVSLDRVNQIFREIRGVLQVKIKRMGYC